VDQRKTWIAPVRRAANTPGQTAPGTATRFRFVDARPGEDPVYPKSRALISQTWHEFIDRAAVSKSQQEQLLGAVYDAQLLYLQWEQVGSDRLADMLADGRGPPSALHEEYPDIGGTPFADGRAGVTARARELLSEEQMRHWPAVEDVIDLAMISGWLEPVDR
jgi:hypothetical protein